MNNDYLPKIIADLYLLKTEEGGRKSPVPVKIYRPPFAFNGKLFHCLIKFDTIDEFIPLGTHIENVPIVFAKSELVINQLKIGDKFGIWEGKIVATGIVKEIINKIP